MSLIRIFTVGGTIDKIYFDAKSSYEMTDADRETIRQAVTASPENEIVITHGTDTMVDTARVLHTIPNKTIVLTGALSPALFKNSDAMFNIGAALTAAQTKLAGVYIAMNGVIFDYDKVRKDVENNRFMAL